MMTGNDKPKSAAATVVALHLIFMCGMNPKGFCDVSFEYLAERTNLSAMTCRRAAQELEDLGEWVVIRTKGRKRTRYYPMFVEGAQTHLLSSVERDRAARKLESQERKAKAKAGKADVESTPEEADSNEVVTAPAATAKAVVEVETHEDPLSYPDFDDSVEEEVPAVLVDTKVKTKRDAEIRDAYLNAVEFKASPEYEWDFPLPAQGTVVDVVDASIDEALKNGNPEQFFVAGSEDTIREELAGRWVQKFGAAYGETHTYSFIQDAYDTFLINAKTQRQFDQVDATICVLGSLGKAINNGLIKAILFSPVEKLNGEARQIRQMVIATVVGRDQTRLLSKGNHYGNNVARPEPTVPAGMVISGEKSYSTSL
jgi:hypothetical protein